MKLTDTSWVSMSGLVPFGWGDRVVKTGTGYSGPGIVRGFALTERGDLRVLVAHVIGEGEGELLHVYTLNQLESAE